MTMIKKICIVFLIAFPELATGQQFPYMEGYDLNPFSISPAYAGVNSAGTIFADYRSDWSGLPEGPKTYQLTYDGRVFKKVGIGGRFIYDRTDIFRHVFLTGTYRYEIKIAGNHYVNFGLSAGTYFNSIDLARYFNNPDFLPDNTLMGGLQYSKLKFATDFGLLYHFRGLEAGVAFSNIMFGSAKYRDTDFEYDPVKNYLVHIAIKVIPGDNWAFKPFVFLRGGQDYPVQLELASQVSYKARFWATAAYRTGNIIGLSIGAEIYNGILLNYSYNLCSDVALSTYSGNQITIGFRLREDNK